MPVTQNDVFKFVSLRRPIDGLTIEPTEDITGSEVINRLQQFEKIDPNDLSSEITKALKGLSVLSEAELERLRSQKVHDLLEVGKIISFSQLEALQIDVDGRNRMSLRQFSSTPEFAYDYRRLTDSWLLSKLNKEPLVDKHEALIRAAHLSQRLQKYPGSLQEPGLIAKLRKAQIVFPRNWRLLHHRIQALEKKHSDKLQHLATPKRSDLVQKIQDKKIEFVALKKKITILQSLQSKAQRAYWQWKIDLPPNFLRPTRTLDSNFYAQFESLLTKDEITELKNTIGEVATNRPKDLDILAEALEPQETIAAANDACAQIRVWEEEEKQELPIPPSHESSEDRPSVRALGWGDLVVARERLMGYDANEIAHIENVLAGEEKVREHERTQKTEEFTETEIIEKTETERDLQTTDRYALQTQTEQTIQDNYSVDAGWSGSIWGGGTAFANAGFNRSESEARSSSNELAKEIVSRTVERIFESVRKLRRLTITEQIRELNKHSIKNVSIDTQTPPSSLSGIYMWVEKIHEVELRHYGTRLMIEFHIPEPAISLLERLNDKPEIKARKPAPFTMGPNDILGANYLCLTKLFGAQSVEPPPPHFVKVGYAWSTPPMEEADGWAESTAGELVKIPANYIPISGHAHLTAPKLSDNRVHLYCAVGGQEVFNDSDTYKADEGFQLTSPQTWPQGLPISILAKGHWDKTLVAHVSVLCERTPQALTDWKLRTWEKIREAHQILMQEYEAAVQAAEFQNNALFQIQARPAVENRRIERDELKKWAIKTMRISTFDFNAVGQVGDFQEIDPLNSDMQAPIVNFFEEAFEWRQMSYFLYPYFWGRRDAWKMRQKDFDKADPTHNAFLQAGAAKVIVPVTPGYEDRVLNYIESTDSNELEKIKKPAQKPEVSYYEDLWLELLLNKNEELAHGIGSLSVEKGNSLVKVNVVLDENGNPLWRLSDRDIGRELFISGDRYFIGSIVDEQQFHLNEPYKGETNENAKYATGSVPFGQPWLVRIPTSLVILSDEKEKLSENS